MSDLSSPFFFLCRLRADMRPEYQHFDAPYIYVMVRDACMLCACNSKSGPSNVAGLRLCLRLATRPVPAG